MRPLPQQLTKMLEDTSPTKEQIVREVQAALNHTRAALALLPRRNPSEVQGIYVQKLIIAERSLSSLERLLQPEPDANPLV